jgi:hypothetical protein
MSAPWDEIWVIEASDELGWGAEQSEGFFYSEEDALEAMKEYATQVQFKLRVRCYSRKGKR